MIPNADAIRAMGGLQLTQLAWELGLAPEGTYKSPYTRWQFWTAAHMKWRPHEDVAQADAVFRSLRARGFVTSMEWCALAKPPCGDVYASMPRGGIIWECTFYQADGAAGEALALLRCAVLARASEEESHV